MTEPMEAAAEQEAGDRRRGLEVWAVEQIDAPPPVEPADPRCDHGSGSEASTASQGTAEGFRCAVRPLPDT